MKIKNVVAQILVVILCLTVFTACAGTPSADPAATTSTPGAVSSAVPTDATGSGNLVPAVGISDETLHVGLDGEPNSLFPNYQGSRVSNRVDSAIFSTLVYWNDETKQVEPSLATAWEWIDDTHIQFTLRDDVAFTNGEKLTSKDVLASLQASTAYTRATYAMMFDIPNSEIVDDTHVIVALTRPYGNLLDILGCTYYAIFSLKGLEDVGSDPAAFAYNPVGSGPYKLEEWKQGESITLTRNDNYWDKDNLPYYKTIVYSFIDDASARALALQSGDVQVIFAVSTSQIAELESAGGIKVNPYLQNVVRPLSFNMKRFPVMADENVRKAILLAIDKKALAHATYLDYAGVSKSSLTGPASPYYSESETYTQDVAAAKKLIEDSGWTAEDLTFTMYAITGMSTSDYEIFQAQMSAIGITIKIETVDLPTKLGMIWGGELPLGFGENDNWDINRMLKFCDSRDEMSADAYVGEYEEELHALIDAAYAADDAGRFEAYAAVQQFCSDHYVMTAISNVVSTDAYADNLTGIRYDAHCWPNIYAMRPLVNG